MIVFPMPNDVVGTEERHTALYEPSRMRLAKALHNVNRFDFGMCEHGNYIVLVLVHIPTPIVSITPLGQSGRD